MTGGPPPLRDEGDHLLSPELALVDHTLARRARELLPDLPAPAVAGAAAIREKSHGFRDPGQADAPPASEAVGRARWRSFAMAVSAGAAAGAVVLWITSVPGHHSSPARPPAARPVVLHERSVPAHPPPPVAKRLSTTRRFVWVRSAGASYYEVLFLRSGERILARRVSGTSLKLPVRWTYAGRHYALTRGRYRWIVRPGYGARREARLGEPVVNSSLVIR